MARERARPENLKAKVESVGQDQEGRSAVLLAAGRRWVPIFIGKPEAYAIDSAVRKVQLQRPMTHDLLVQALQKTGWQVERMVVARLEQTTFYGELHLTRGRQRKVLDCRPSDGLAVAVRAQAPIEIAREVLKQAGVGERPQLAGTVTQEDVYPKGTSASQRLDEVIGRAIAAGADRVVVRFDGKQAQVRCGQGRRSWAEGALAPEAYRGLRDYLCTAQPECWPPVGASRVRLKVERRETKGGETLTLRLQRLEGAGD